MKECVGHERVLYGTVLKSVNRLPRSTSPAIDGSETMRCESPSLILIQASSRSWSGGEDLCLREFDGAPAVAHTIRVRTPPFPRCSASDLSHSAFDSDGPLGESSPRRFDGDVQVLYGFDASPLDRMLMAAQGLADEAFVLRVDGLHFPADFELAATMLSCARRSELDGIKTPDDFPTQLSVDVLRVGALRRARTLIEDDASPFLVHPKFLLATHPSFRFARQESLPTYSDEWLTAIRDKATVMLGDVQRLEVGGLGRIPQGDQLSYHYELASTSSASGRSRAGCRMRRGLWRENDCPTMCSRSRSRYRRAQHRGRASCKW